LLETRAFYLDLLTLAPQRGAGLKRVLVAPGAVSRTLFRGQAPWLACRGATRASRQGSMGSREASQLNLLDS